MIRQIIISTNLQSRELFAPSDVRLTEIDYTGVLSDIMAQSNVDIPPVTQKPVNSMTQRESIVVSIVRALDDQTGNEGLEAPVQLYDYIDAESLSHLLEHSQHKDESSWKLTFAVDDVDVTVTSDGDVSVE